MQDKEWRYFFTWLEIFGIHEQQPPGVAQLYWSLAADPKVGSSISRCASLTGGGLNNPEGPFELCSSKIITIITTVPSERLLGGLT